uniref:Uncharacterized protein n=1 Tax=Anguilla anguilla TaxID=7936 RepID=A0A0E9UG18_ANGAN
MSLLFMTLLIYKSSFDLDGRTSFYFCFCPCLNYPPPVV